MESKKRKNVHRLLFSFTVGICVCLLLNVCEVNASDEDERLNSDSDTTPETLIDTEINYIDNPKKTSNFGGYIVGKFVDTLVQLPSILPYGAKNDIARMYTAKDKNNRTYNLYGDNSMWDGLFRECGTKTTLTCVKKNVFEYLDRSIVTEGDLPITDSLIFTRNGNNMFENKYDARVNNASYHKTHSNVTSDIVSNNGSSGRSFNSFYSLTNVLYDKGYNFIMTHDLELQLPEVLFDGAVVRISPKSMEEDGGALLKLEVDKKRNDAGEGRIFFKKHKKKLMMAFFALMMVIKMIKVKLMFLLPLLLGVGTAKKIFLKLLLFVFPAFAHIFKFCAYYHAAHTKFHHHHHQIAHHHHHVPVPVPVHVDHSHTVHVDNSHPPPMHFSPSGPSGPTGHGWAPSAPEFIASRNDYLTPSQENELESWGLMSKGAFHIPAGVVQSNSPSYNAYNQYLDEQRVSRSALPVTEASNIFLSPPPPPPQQSPARYHPNMVTPSQYTSPPYPNNLQHQKQQQLLMLHQQNQKQNNHFGPPNSVQQQKIIQVSGPEAITNKQSAQIKLQQQRQQQLLLEQQKQELLMRQQQTLKLKPLTQRPPTEGTIVPVTYDSFYSPILQQMDNVFVQLGFNEEACRERLVCSMYKTPERFSPHSNLISAQLSRDPRELQKPAVPNSASVRFHRYVQAARDGQDLKDCLKMYPACTVKTEK